MSAHEWPEVRERFLGENEEGDEWPDENEQFWAAVDMSIDLMKEERDQ